MECAVQYFFKDAGSFSLFVLSTLCFINSTIFSKNMNQKYNERDLEYEKRFFNTSNILKMARVKIFFCEREPRAV